jgi:hypothetical protein
MSILSQILGEKLVIEKLELVITRKIVGSPGDPRDNGAVIAVQ